MHPAGATKELSGSSMFLVRGEGGQMELRDGAEYEGSLVGELGGHEFITELNELFCQAKIDSE